MFLVKVSAASQSLYQGRNHRIIVDKNENTFTLCSSRGWLRYIHTHTHLCSSCCGDNFTAAIPQAVTWSSDWSKQIWRTLSAGMCAVMQQKNKTREEEYGWNPGWEDATDIKVHGVLLLMLPGLSFHQRQAAWSGLVNVNGDMYSSRFKMGDALTWSRDIK